MREVIKYFGYGANRDHRMMSAITGKSPDELVGRSGVLRGFGLAEQNIGNIPCELSEDSKLPVSPREIILSKWNKSFRTYVIYPKLGGLVAGTIWDLSREDRDRVEDWELVGDWYQEAHGLVDTGLEAVLVETEAMGPGQNFDKEVDGLYYPTWLQPANDFEIVAAAVRAEYDARQQR